MSGEGVRGLEIVELSNMGRFLMSMEMHQVMP